MRSLNRPLRFRFSGKGYSALWTVNTSTTLPTENLADFRPSNEKTKQDATNNCSSTDVSDVCFSGKAGNTLDALPKCLLHLAAFNVRAVNQEEQKDAIAGAHEPFHIDVRYVAAYKILLPQSTISVVSLLTRLAFGFQTAVRVVLCLTPRISL